MKKQNVFTLSQITLAEGEASSKVEVLREGVIRDRDWRITKNMLKEYVDNFKQNVYGTEVQVNLEHNRGSEAAGWVTELFCEGKSLYALVDWTVMGQEKIQNKLFKFVSAELAMEYPHHETGEICQNVFIGLALTNTPALKGQVALTLSEIKEFNNNLAMFKKYLELLAAKAIVSKEEKETMRAMLSELPEEEKTEAADAVADVEAKPEAEEKQEESDEEKVAREAKEKEEADAKAAADAQAEADKKAADEKTTTNKTTKAADGDQALAEKTRVAALEEENKSLKQKEARRDLESSIAPFMLSDKNSTGFLEAKSKSKLVDLLMRLGDEERAETVSLLAEIMHVELGEKGSTDTAKAKTAEEMLEDQKVRAQALSAEKKIPFHQALGEVISQDEMAKKV